MYPSTVHSESPAPGLCPLLSQGIPGGGGDGTGRGDFSEVSSNPLPRDSSPLTQARAALHFPRWFPPSPTPGGTLCDAAGCVLAAC